MLLFAHEDMAGFYKRWSSSLGMPRPHDEFEILALLNNRDILKPAFEQLYNTVHRSALKELFEITKTYCKETNQKKMLTLQPWYQFWRILRNCFSHDFRFHFNDYDRKQLPLSWADVTLDFSLEGKPLTQGTFPREKLLAFLDEIQRFVEKDLA
jgi:hypothetical protein